MMKKLSHLIIGILAYAGFASATIINVPVDYDTIQVAIDNAIVGDTILVQPGTYTENIDYDGKDLVIGSLFLVSGDTSYISQTIIDGDSSGSVVTFNNEETSAAVLAGFVIRNGYSSSGAGIWCQVSDPTITHCYIVENYSTCVG
ncbi:hypothetical protein CEE37_07570 [candidate division LCP-89 bacterium B3_LCP]|uniref:DUF1565 domain-containing protein n=1 Tax=candidate division LCP-89 bacterium B3_LCP TaxID=2012998 RepID=A0A532V0S4_UNCL8|nr:MAG: hypothetical protein CEE37_07570 [candidate division LCP-89 bacterium B3_LCP]